MSRNQPRFKRVPLLECHHCHVQPVEVVLTNNDPVIVQGRIFIKEPGFKRQVVLCCVKCNFRSTSTLIGYACRNWNNCNEVDAEGNFAHPEGVAKIHTGKEAGQFFARIHDTSKKHDNDIRPHDIQDHIWIPKWKQRYYILSMESYSKKFSYTESRWQNDSRDRDLLMKGLVFESVKALNSAIEVLKKTLWSVPHN